ncbi:MAG: NUDIX hydrolase [Bacteroidia bacterium]|nr:NUDIX hydrolase [Bacteroidia bacterium]
MFYLYRVKTTQNIKIAVDAVVFGYDTSNGLSLLLIRRKFDPYQGSWALPGGFVLDAESLEEAVTRELKEETGVHINYLEQLYTFGSPKRDPRQRIVSVSYFAIVRESAHQEPEATTDASDAAWFNVTELPNLAFDHQTIVNTAIERLRSKVRYNPVGFELLDTKFPFSDLEKLYSSLLDRPVDRRNFKKKIMSLGILDELNEKAPHKGAGRPGRLYRFNRKRYDELVRDGFHFEL